MRHEFNWTTKLVYFRDNDALVHHKTVVESETVEGLGRAIEAEVTRYVLMNDEFVTYASIDMDILGDQSKMKISVEYDWHDGTKWSKVEIITAE